MHLEAVDLDRLKRQAVCFSGEPSLNHDKKRNNWSMPSSLGRGPGFDAGDEKLGEDKTSDLSSSLSFAGSWYLIFSQFCLGSKYSYKILEFSTSMPVVALNNFSSSSSTLTFSLSNIFSNESLSQFSQTLLQLC